MPICGNLKDPPLMFFYSLKIITYLLLKNQFLSNVHSIYSDFDHNWSLKVRGVFPDISKVFDKVWHEGISYELETLGTLGNFLSDWQQRVFLMAKIQNGHQY